MCQLHQLQSALNGAAKVVINMLKYSHILDYYVCEELHPVPP